jgi:hypothetical protein
MQKKPKKPAKRARKKAARAKVQDLASSAASDDVKGHLLGFVKRSPSFFIK